MSRTDPSVVTTRRVIVKTAVRLAYAAPLVAASLDLHAAHASVPVSQAPICPDGCAARFNLADGTSICGIRLSPPAGPLVCCDASHPCPDETGDCVVSNTDADTGEVTPHVCPDDPTMAFCQIITPC